MSNVEFTDEDMQALALEMESEKNANTYKSLYWRPANEGAYPIRIISPLKQLFGEKLFYEKHMVHYIGQRSYFCLNQTLKDKNGNIHMAEPCPICSKSKAMYNGTHKGTEEWNIAGSLKAKERYVARIVVRNKKLQDGTDDEAKPEFWEFGSKIHGWFFEQIKNGEVGNFLSLKEGRDYNLVKKGTGRNTDYSSSTLSMRQTPIFTDVEKLKKLMEYFPKMEYSQLVEFHSADEMKAALNEFFNVNTEPEGETSLRSTANQTVEQSSVDTSSSGSSEGVQEDIDSLLSMI